LLRDVPVAGLTATAADKIVDHVIAVEKAMTSIKLLVVQRAAEGETWRTRGARSAAEDLAKRSGTSTGRANDVLDTSRNIDDQPEVEDALREGKLSGDQASMIADAAAADPDAQADLIDEASRGDSKGLRDKCGRVKAAADADREATHRRVHRERFHRRWTGTDGSVNGCYKLAPRAGARLGGVLESFLAVLSRQARAEGRHDTLDQLAADALVAMAEAAAGNATGDTAPASKTQAYVLVDFDALLRGHPQAEERCELSTVLGPLPLPVSVVQEILNDAFLTGVFLRGTDVQSVIRFGRHVPAAVRDALRIRDDFACEVEGCSRRARLEVDHHQPVSRDGPTSYANLGHKCWYHHQEKTRADRLFDTGPAP
jgi:hypothetical protein